MYDDEYDDEYDDDIIKELHEIRQRLLEKAGGLEGYLKQIREQQRLHPENLVDFSKEAKIAASKARRKQAKNVETVKTAKPRTKAKATTRKPGQRKKAVAT